MFKLIGGAIVMIAATLLGMAKYNELCERRKALADIHAGGVKILNALRCMCLPLYECFKEGGGFFSEAAQIMETGLLPGEAVREAAGKWHMLTKEDREIISRFSGGLSAQDCKGQISNTQLFLKELEGAIKDAQHQLETRGKLFVKGSILSAAAVVLLLL